MPIHPRWFDTAYWQRIAERIAQQERLAAKPKSMPKKNAKKG